MKFLADDMLGRLAKWLRILGCDTLHLTQVSDDAVLRRAVREKRILLTRDRELAGRIPAGSGLWIQSENYIIQLRKIIRTVPLKVRIGRLFSLCLTCNIRVRKTAKSAVRGKVPAQTYKHQRTFWRCPKCSKIYWRGTHYKNALKQLK